MITCLIPWIGFNTRNICHLNDVRILKKEKNEIELEWFGHSCIKLQVDNKSYFFDPVRNNSMLCTTLIPQNEREVYGIFISHEHWDHCDADTVMQLMSSNTKVYCPLPAVNSLIHRMTFEVKSQKELEKLREKIVIKRKGEVEKVQGFEISCLEASEGLAYVFQVDEKKILFMGDSTATREMIKIEPDVILFPVWAVYGEEAKRREFLELGKKSLCIPIHYHSEPEALTNFYIPQKSLLKLLPKEINLKILKRNESIKL